MQGKIGYPNKKLKLKPIWENILIYKNAFNFTPKLISFMVSASAELGKANTGNVPHSFIQDFIKTNDNEAFLLCNVRQAERDEKGMA